MKLNKKAALKAKAHENTTVSKNKKVVKEGAPLEHSPRHGVPLQSRSVGIAKGITRNMGDFESLRVDVWLTDYVQDDETQEEALARIGAIVDETLEEAVFSMIDE